MSRLIVKARRTWITLSEYEIPAVLGLLATMAAVYILFRSIPWSSL